MLLVNKHLLLFSTEEKAYYSALISLCGDRVVLVLVLYLQGSINIFTKGRQEGCEQSQAASPAQFPHPMPRRGCRDGYRAESWHGAASPGSPTSAPVPGGCAGHAGCPSLIGCQRPRQLLVRRSRPGDSASAGEASGKPVGSFHLQSAGHILAKYRCPWTWLVCRGDSVLTSACLL